MSHRSTEELKEMARARSRRWRERHPGAGAVASQKHRKKYGSTPWPAKRDLGIEITQIKTDTPCADCDQKYPPECMDFDHVSGQKIENVGTMVAHGWNRERVLTELAKCELVCANCHRIRTKKRRNRGTK